MTETYYPLGYNFSHASLALTIGTCAAVAFALVGWWTRLGSISRVGALLCALWAVLAYILGTPTLWLEVGVILIAAIASLAIPAKKGFNRTPKVGPLLGLAALVGLIFAYSGRTAGPRITIGSERISWGFEKLFSFSPAVEPREGLLVTERPSAASAPGDEQWSFKGKDQHGPLWGVEDVFWGPHGFVDGRTVGKRIAAWAGTKPQIVP